ncbi:kinase-like protein [Crucibulum laeve]|uniref:Kinase-like protein n=1 Tax=Crucibulum laeve TaxID=68775 RepID=A0A5C3LMG9_9AGAR|nr:kinase-like protein [Crucibulum laeve]
MKPLVQAAATLSSASLVGGCLRALGWLRTDSTYVSQTQFFIRKFNICREKSHVAIKILNGYYTELEKHGRIWELEALKQLSSPTSSAHCLQLISNFTLRGRGSAGEHLCLVTQLLGGDIKSLHTVHETVFPLLLAKRILLHVLRGIAHAHSRGVVHTDLKHDNIFFDAHISTETLGNILVSDPPRRHPPEASFDGTVEAAVTQPLPIPTVDEAMERIYVVGDFGSAQSVSNHTTDMITAPPLRPPEIIIGGPWDEKVDIWTFGCLIFELVTGHGLFRYEPLEKYKLDPEHFMLYHMVCYTGEQFRAEQLMVSSRAARFFDTECNLRTSPPLIKYPLEVAIRRYKVIEEPDIYSTAALMRRCLRLNPENRASASELLVDPWFSGVD